MSESCPNCGHEPVGRYCPECGQKQGPLIPSVRDLIGEAVHESLELDGRFPRTIRLLVTRPGFLDREWWDGRRAPYVSPIRLYLVSSLVFFGAVSLFGFDMDYVDPPVPLAGDDPRPVTAMFLQDRFQLLVTAFVVLGVPLLALIYWNADRRGRTLVQHVILTLHLLSFLFFVAAAAWILHSVGLPRWSSVLLVFAALVYYDIRVEKGLLDRGWKQQWSLGRKRWLGFLGMLASGALGMAWGVAMGLEIEDRIHDGLDAYAGFLYTNWHDAVLVGDTPRAAVLRPAAREQYERLGSWSRHQRWHVAELRFADGCPQCALETLNPILQSDSSHIPGLTLSAQIADALDSTALANRRWRTLAARTDEEWTAALADYGEHASRLVDARRQAAERATALEATDSLGPGVGDVGADSPGAETASDAAPTSDPG